MTENDFYDVEYDDPGEKKTRHLLRWGILVLLLLIAILLASVRIQDFTVIGNTQYSSEEIVHMIFSDPWDTDTAYCFLKDKTKPHKELPFVQRYDLDFTGPFSVSITVYEKNVVVYGDYMSSHMYCDKDGIIVESTSNTLEGIPRITGLSFGSIVLYKELPVENKDVFNNILNLTGALQTYDIECNEIQYDALLNATLQIGDITVRLGSNKDMEMKISTLHDILPHLTGLRGELNLSDYSETTDHESYIFKERSGDASSSTDATDAAVPEASRDAVDSEGEADADTDAEVDSDADTDSNAEGAENANENEREAAE